MLDRADATFGANLEQVILQILHGDGKVAGLYQSFPACPNWDSINRLAGQVHAYETVLKEMHNLRVRMNGDDMPKRQSGTMN